MDIELIEILENCITNRRKDLLSSILNERTRYITVVLEDIYQSQNASAVLRTCDCFGIQDLHIIENNNKYKINPDVTLGSDKWLTLKQYRDNRDNSMTAITELKDNGYRIVATTPVQKHTPVEDFDLTKGKIALCFGTELTGLSDTILNIADEFISIPMYGFTESFNISVSAAIILHHLSYRLRNSSIPWKLNENDSLEVKFNWLKRSVKNSESILKKFYSDKNE
jgi:tRNA (guanosine-2'-O-)-methyltransferase